MGVHGPLDHPGGGHHRRPQADQGRHPHHQEGVRGHEVAPVGGRLPARHRRHARRAARVVGVRGRRHGVRRRDHVDRRVGQDQGEPRGRQRRQRLPGQPDAPGEPARPQGGEADGHHALPARLPLLWPAVDQPGHPGHRHDDDRGHDRGVVLRAGRRRHGHRGGGRGRGGRGGRGGSEEEEVAHARVRLVEAHRALSPGLHRLRRPAHRAAPVRSRRAQVRGAPDEAAGAGLAHGQDGHVRDAVVLVVPAEVRGGGDAQRVHHHRHQGHLVLLGRHPGHQDDRHVPGAHGDGEHDRRDHHVPGSRLRDVLLRPGRVRHRRQLPRLPGGRRRRAQRPLPRRALHHDLRVLHGRGLLLRLRHRGRHHPHLLHHG
mmetsp:Transcript_9994/g.35021  ORF Transcript_9994/g.35021 Transcript_9994/m.35021 type:complete len:372 (+) Transcript_9994:1224-2339(+)